ncbi:phosphoenolpyruvate carboxylase [Actinoallomurus iriomotensis]|nr:phosphoenolpyruvate carboxylase [Actinoallomurus iriomotensis]
MPEPLRADVRLLSSLLGQVLVEYGGQDLLDDVEALRHAVIAARRDEKDVDDVAAIVSGWPLDRAELVARAFTVYFHLTNLAEEHQRIRTLRERDTGEEPLRESVADAVRRIGDERVGRFLDDLELRPVLTAHPTEARRRAVVTAILRISALLGELNDPRTGSGERDEIERRLLEEIDLLWRTSPLRRTKPDPLDEVRTAMAIFDETLFRVVPAIYRSLDTALAPGTGARPPLARPYLRFGSWIGGDRDGNPYVTAQITREAIGVQADHILRALAAACTRVGRTLTTHEGTTPASAALHGALAAARAAQPGLIADIGKRSPGEPHRQFLLYAAERIEATRRRDADLGYRAPADLIADLRLVQDSLVEAGAVRQAYGELQHLIWQVETFGFHLAELEVRQHSGVHEQALAEIRARSVVPEAREGQRLSEQTEEVLDTLRVIAWVQERFGVDACRRYVISFTRTAEDVATVYELAEHAAVGGKPPVLDVVPLFETGEDLDRSPAVLDGMLRLAPVRRRLLETGRSLEVMLGYSDSAKQLGPTTATLKLYDTQAALASWAARHDIRLTLFHGRGGALGRGGGPANRAVLAQAPGSVAGRFKVTEQGEVIFARYGHKEIARRHVEQVTSAVLMASTPGVEERALAGAERFRPLADRISAAAERTYRSLVEAEGFADWFARVSPLHEIGALRLGSRPSRRKATASLEDLRAIPWVFSWTQTRVNLPGWYGLGSGLAAVDDMDELREAYASWPLFAALLDNAEMSLAKTDRAIAERYLDVGDRADLAAAVLAEYDRTRSLVLQVTGHTRLLEDRNVLSRAVELRNPYVDALSHLQLRALQELRAGIEDDAQRAKVEDLLLLAAAGVAAGLQNTG